MKLLPISPVKKSAELIPFPLHHRVGKVRDVARKLASKTTERHADYYREQVSDALRGQLTKVGVSIFDQEQQIARFWSEVDREVTRIHFRDSHGGAA